MYCLTPTETMWVENHSKAGRVKDCIHASNWVGGSGVLELITRRRIHEIN